MTTELKIYEQEEQALATLEDLFKDVSVDLSNKEGIDSCKDAARKFQKVRTGVEKLRKEANSEARAHIKSVDDKAKSIQARIAPLEEKFSAPLKLRTARLKAGIDEIDAVVEQCIDKDSAFIGDKLQWLETVNVDDFFEYKKDAKASLFTANDKLTDMFNAAIKKEQEEAEAKQRQEEETKRIAEDQKRLKITERIQKLQGIPFDMFNATAKEVKEKLTALDNHKPKAEDFDDRHQEAVTAFETVIDQLTKLLTQKEQEEAQAQAEAQRAKKQGEEQRRLTEEMMATNNDSDDHKDDCKGCPDCQGINCAITNQAAKEELEQPYLMNEDQAREFNDSVADKNINIFTEPAATSADDAVNFEAQGEERPLNEVMNSLIYGLTKEAARSDFLEFLESWGVTEDEYDRVKAHWQSQGIKPYV